MEESNWSKETQAKIQTILISMNEKQAKKLKVNVLARVVNRVDQGSQDGCNECESLKVSINEMIVLLESNNSIDIKHYKSTFRQIIKHLVKQHGLVEEGTYLAQWIAIGIAIGAAFTTLYAGSIGIGLLFGVVIGTKFDEDAKKQGKVI